MKNSKSKISRRNFLLGTVGGASAMAAMHLLPASGGGVALAASDAVEKAAQASYEPTFFTQEELAFVTAAVGSIIPTDEMGPGAIEAGVPEFIDKQMETPYAVGSNWYMQGPFHPEASPLFGYQVKLLPKDVYRLGIAEANAQAKKRFGDVFNKLTPQKQDEFLSLLESGEIEFQKVPSKVFFATLLQNTREGFFSDPKHGGNKGMVGWKLINFPGARADFMDWVERNERYPFPPVAISGLRG